MKPALDAKVACHLRHPQTDRLLVDAEALQPEGQLMPDLIRHDLVIRILHDIADSGTLLAQPDVPDQSPVKENLPGSLSVWGERTFQLPQKRCLSTAAPPAKSHVLPALNRQIDIIKRFPISRRRVGKAQIFDLKMCHFNSSVRLIPAGIARNSAYATTPAIV